MLNVRYVLFCVFLVSLAEFVFVRAICHGDLVCTASRPPPPSGYCVPKRGVSPSYMVITKTFRRVR